MPLYAFARRSGLNADSAQDAVQGFFLHCLRGDLFSKADDRKGRLRSLLCASFRHHLQHSSERERRQKRGGDAIHVPLLPENAERLYQDQVTNQNLPADQVFTRIWAHSVLHRSLQRLGSHYESRGDAERFRVLRDYLPWNGGDESCAEGASSIGLSPNAFRVALSRMRKHYREYIVSEVQSTMSDSDPVSVEDELRHLFQALSS